MNIFPNYVDCYSADLQTVSIKHKFKKKAFHLILNLPKHFFKASNKTFITFFPRKPNLHAKILEPAFVEVEMLYERVEPNRLKCQNKDHC